MKTTAFVQVSATTVKDVGELIGHDNVTVLAEDPVMLQITVMDKGHMTAVSGDWVVTTKAGPTVCSNDFFKKNYAPICFGAADTAAFEASTIMASMAAGLHELTKESGEPDALVVHTALWAIKASKAFNRKHGVRP